MSTVSIDILKKSFKRYEENHFIQFLTRRYGSAIVRGLVETYFIGTSNRWPGATVFPQIDMQGRIRTAKIMAYDTQTGRRRKRADGNSLIDWVHNKIDSKPYHLQQCFFGEHLLPSRPDAAVAIVESEKTVLIASIYLPEFIWLASGSLSLLSSDRCQALVGRKLYLFPDLNGYQKWCKKAAEIASITSVVVSDLLERKARPQEREKGLDLADYLLKFDLKDFQGNRADQDKGLRKTYSDLIGIQH